VKRLTIALQDELYQELIRESVIASKIDEPGQRLRPEDFARECVESVLASRRLDRMDSQRICPA